MRHPCLILTALALVLFANENSFALPVYLKPESRFPTGNQPRSWLESRTKQVQLQRWLHVKTKDRAYGWIAEDHALTALRLVDQVQITEDTVGRSGPRLEAVFGQPVIKKNTNALVLEFEGSWVRLQPLPASENKQAWVATEKLKPVFEGAPQRAFVYHSTSLRVDGRPGARPLETLDEGTFVHIVSESPEWIEVRNRGNQGWIPKADVWRSVDLGEKGIRPMFALAPLRSGPLPYASLTRSMSMGMNMELVNAKTIRWGQVNLKDIGEAWWPMSDGPEENSEIGAGGSSKVARTSDSSEKIKTAELFTRKIFDMATSKAIPNLKFVSAEGIYRTTDGETWTKIPTFKNQNYPISVASSGAVFIGPYVSDDHGETFEQWIKWDSLVYALSDSGKSEQATPKSVRIMEVKPEDSSGRRVTLRLKLGDDKPIRIGTDDQGTSWRRF